MCNCINEVEKNVLEHVKEKNPDAVVTGNLNLSDNTGIQEKALTFGGEFFLFLNFKCFIQTTKKNGELSAPKKKNISLSLTYCPFCGKKYYE